MRFPKHIPFSIKTTRDLEALTILKPFRFRLIDFNDVHCQKNKLYSIKKLCCFLQIAGFVSCKYFHYLKKLINHMISFQRLKKIASIYGHGNGQ